MLKVFANTWDWYVAKNVDDAIAQWEELTGEKISDYEREEWDECSPNAILKIRFDASEKVVGPVGCTIEPKPHDKVLITATISAWAEHNGRGFLCSTEY